MLNALTIDLEDYFQVQAFSNVVPYEDWESYDSRIEHNTYHLLELLNEASQPSNLTPYALRPKPSSTFFILGWIAERYPHLVQAIKNRGHEIACHGYAHKLIYRQSKEEFRADVKRAKAILEDITGDEVIGYRAPSYSIIAETLWAFEVLAEEGFKYDSSIFPIRHDTYGIPSAPRFPFSIAVSNSCKFSMLNSNAAALSTAAPFILEFPLSTIQILGFNFPISGGGYFRMFPYFLIKKGLKGINEKEKIHFIFYIHPWEFDGQQPRFKEAKRLSRFRHYINLGKTENRFWRLLQDFQFTSIKNIIMNYEC